MGTEEENTKKGNKINNQKSNNICLVFQDFTGNFLFHPATIHVDSGLKTQKTKNLNLKIIEIFFCVFREPFFLFLPLLLYMYLSW